MLEETVTVVNRLGLHARAAAHLVKSAGKFKSKITLSKTDGSSVADAKSMLSVLTLAASKGTQLVLNVEGEDEAIAFETIAGIFANGFGET